MAKEYVEERNGGYYLAGTRVSLDSIVYCFREGMSAETIASEFETLNLAQVYGAIAHYLDNQLAIDAYLIRQQEKFEAMRKAAPPLSEALRKKLDAAKEAFLVERNRT
jgi:uncharacterized protein (DUF433 family)